MKKTTKIFAMGTLIILITIFIVVACMRIGQLLMFRYSSLWQFSANYEEYADDFNMVKDYIEATFQNESGKWLSVSNSDGQGIRIFDPDANEYLQVPSDILSSLETIRKYGFPNKDATFDTIRIHDDRISFCIENGHYALVFSPNVKPSWVNLPNEDVTVKVRSIRDGWYHVTIDPG